MPPQGCHYWEAVVSGSTAYRLGVACSTADRNSPVGENNLSWCLQCVPAPSGYVWKNELHLRSTGIPVNVCPLLSLQLQVPATAQKHSLQRVCDGGARAGGNSPRLPVRSSRFLQCPKRSAVGLFQPEFHGAVPPGPGPGDGGQPGNQHGAGGARVYRRQIALLSLLFKHCLQQSWEEILSREFSCTCVFRLRFHKRCFSFIFI